MTEQIITITGLEFTTEGRPIAHGAIIREGAGTLEETMKAGGAQMGTLHPMDGCPMGRVEAKFAGQTATAVFFGERFLLAAEEERKRHPHRRVISLGIGDVTQPIAPVAAAALRTAAAELATP